MVEKSNKKLKKSFVTEEDISNLLQRYTATTVMALLREVAQFGGVKIDWNVLVQKTSTGISNAREYQMLWRHVAYRNALADKLEDGAQPLDDDSDLECELEAFPAASGENLKEAEACTKIMMASDISSLPIRPNSTTVEAPLVINIPDGQSIGAASKNPHMSSVRRMNITVPVYVQKQPQAASASIEALDRNGSASGTNNSQKKRKNWSKDEDKLLMKGVDKYGEGNWGAIAKIEFKGERTAAQLSQRWPHIRKKNVSLNIGRSSGISQLSEAQEATRRAVDHALPMKSSITNAVGGKASNNSVPPLTVTESSPGQNQSQLFSNMLKSSSVGPLEFSAKSQLNMKTLTSNLNADPVTAAAVAAGARIVSQVDATALLKPQANNTVHIMRSGVSSMKPSVLVGAPTYSEAHPSVRVTPTGSGTISSSLTDMSRHALLRTSSLKSQQNQSTSAVLVERKFDPTNTELAQKQVTRATAGSGVSESKDVAKERVQEGTCVSENEFSEQADKLSARNQEVDSKNQAADGGGSTVPVNKKSNDNETVESLIGEGKNSTATTDKREIKPSAVTNGGSEDGESAAKP